MFQVRQTNFVLKLNTDSLALAFVSLRVIGVLNRTSLGARLP